MNGYNDLVLPFRLNFREVVENKEAVLNGLSAIQRFFDGNIWLPLGVNVKTLFVRGVVGATEGLCDWFEVPASWPPFEPEKWEEKEHLLYVLCNDPNCSFGGRRITRKYERNKATRKSCSVTGQDAHIRYSPYMARRPLERVTMTSKRDSAIQHDNT